MKTNSPLFTIIFGPTASGKSQYALELAKQYSANILSFDSRQVYQGMDIVTGKDIPTNFSQKKTEKFSFYTDGEIEMYGFDCVSPEEDWSIAHFYHYAKPIIHTHHKNQKPLILIGGSWQYVSALFDPPESLFVPKNPELRKDLSQLGLQHLQNRLQQLDIHRWETLNSSDRGNPRRLIRALEIITAKLPQPQPLFSSQEAQFIFFQPNILWLEKRIEDRVIKRIEHGALLETQNLIEKFPNWNSPAFSATGYSLLRQFLEEKINRIELEEQWSQTERQYAKRQLTWIKSLLPKFSQAKIYSPEKQD